MVHAKTFINLGRFAVDLFSPRAHALIGEIKTRMQLCFHVEEDN